MSAVKSAVRASILCPRVDGLVLAAVAACPSCVGIAIALLVLSACGGSGSSGFDAGPASEAAAIVQAMEEGDCIAFEGTTFCGAGAESPLDGDGSATVRIDDPGDALICENPEGGDQCAASLAVVPDGFPAGTMFRAAVSGSEHGPWTLAETTPTSMPDPGGAAALEVSIVVPQAGSPATPAPLLVAVLVYVRPVPGDLPAQADRLGNYAADFVYVSPRLQLERAG